MKIGEIEKGVEVPTTRSVKWSKLCGALSVGDSFELEAEETDRKDSDPQGYAKVIERFRANILQSLRKSRRKGKEFTTRRTGEKTLRVWRTK